MYYTTSSILSVLLIRVLPTYPRVGIHPCRQEDPGDLPYLSSINSAVPPPFLRYQCIARWGTQSSLYTATSTTVLISIDHSNNINSTICTLGISPGQRPSGKEERRQLLFSSFVISFCLYGLVGRVDIPHPALLSSHLLIRNNNKNDVNNNIIINNTTTSTMADSDSTEGRLTLNSQLDELDAHLDSLFQQPDPSAQFNATLFDRINYQLGPVSYPDLTARFLPRLGLILKKTAEAEKNATITTSQSKEGGYPPPLITLTTKLLRPLPFTQALELCQPAYLVTALSSPEEHINSLALAILDKATRSPSDASILAASTTPEDKSGLGLLEAFLERWLVSPSVAVGQQGVLILGDLLDVDCPLSQPLFTDEQKELLDIRLVARRAPGHGAVWRRLFGDEALCWMTLQKIETDLLPSSTITNTTITVAEKNRILAQRSFAQDRLLRLLPRLAILDFTALTRSVAPLGPNGTPVSLLDFATLHMVDRHGDELMHLTWIDYVMKLVGALRVADTAKLSVDTLRRLVREAKDPALLDALWGMPENLVWTPPGEADAMRAWLRHVAPRPAPRIGGVVGS